MKKCKQYSSKSKCQQGIVLLITLLVLVAMMLVSVGMMRSVDTSVAAVGNVAFRQSADESMNSAIESTLRNLANCNFLNGSNPNLLDSDGAVACFPSAVCSRYFASIQAGENSGGVPALLQTAMGGCAATDASGNVVQVVVERMCNAAGAANVAGCLTGPALPPSGTLRDRPNKVGQRPLGGGNDFGAGVTVFYRVSVRVDGPNNTVSLAQAIFGT